MYNFSKAIHNSEIVKRRKYIEHISATYEYEKRIYIRSNSPELK